MKKVFLKRLLFFSIGLFFGLLFLNFIIDQKTDGKGIDYCYFPNCRVLKDLRKNSDVAPFIKDSVLVEGNVLFNKSETRSTPCQRYIVEYSNEEYRFERCDSIVRYLK